jgi:hypothetical protein
MRIFVLSFILLFARCSNMIDVPSAVSATYLAAHQAGQEYIENLTSLTLLDSSMIRKLSYDSLYKLDLTYIVYLHRFKEAEDEVSILEKLHPEYSDSEVAQEYYTFYRDSLMPVNQRHFKNISYMIEVMKHKKN